MGSTELRAKRGEVAARLAELALAVENDENSTAAIAALVAERQASGVVLQRLDEKIRAAEIAERQAVEAERQAAIAAAVAPTIPRALQALVELDAALTALSDAASRDTIAPADSREVMAGLLLLKRHVDLTLTDLRRRGVDGIPAARPVGAGRPAVKVYQRAAPSGPLHMTGGRSQSVTVDVRGRPLLR
jgi:hypothetical protein